MPTTLPHHLTASPASIRPRRRDLVAYFVLFFGGILLIPAMMLLGQKHDAALRPSAPRALVVGDANGTGLIGYRLGESLAAPDCANDAQARAMSSGASATQACIRARTLDPNGSGRVMVDRLDLGRHYANVNWIRPVCLTLDHGRIAAIALHFSAPTDPHAQDAAASLARQFHATPRIARWQGGNAALMYRFASQTWPVEDAKVVVLTQDIAWNSKYAPGQREAMIVVARPSALAGFHGGTTSLDDDCPVIGDER